MTHRLSPPTHQPSPPRLSSASYSRGARTLERLVLPAHHRRHPHGRLARSSLAGSRQRPRIRVVRTSWQVTTSSPSSKRDIRPPRLVSCSTMPSAAGSSPRTRPVRRGGVLAACAFREARELSGNERVSPVASAPR
ncbi:hypothetical protein B0H17DRAFT_1034471 [Mycena rosella]|uniref:Uncharacterized protein n=1 Tax=Mycena rosella TaxID=1033263 RepID=A0AAD7M9D0_MYCRO|nr:hypothetical protein B0H17DRAFT_1034471 [Mycena rosella]